MKRSFFFVLIILSANSLLAQNVTIDSLKALLPLSQGVERIDVLLELAILHGNVDNDVVHDFSIESLKIATHLGDSLRIVQSGKVLAWALRYSEQYDSAIVIGKYCEGIAFRNHFTEKLQGSILNGLGSAYLFNGKYDLALSSFLRAITLHEVDDDKASILVVLNNVGLTYFKLGNSRLALKYYQECINVSNSIGSDYNRYVTLSNISLCYIKLGNLEEARKVLQLPIERCLSNCSDREIVIVFFPSGRIWYEMDSLHKAEKDFMHSYQAARRIEDHRFMLDNIIYLSKIYLKRGELSKAEQFLTEGEVMANNTLLDREEMNLYEELSALCKAKGDIRKLSFYQTNNLMRLHAEATEKEYKTQLTSQERTLQLKDEIINKQLGINVLIGLALILLAILVYVLVRIFNDYRLSNIVLIKKVNDRTADLEHNRHHLLFAIEQQDKALTHWRNTLDISVNAVQELCSTAMSAELNSDGLKYFIEIDGVASKVSKSLANIQLVSTLGESN